MTFIEAVALLAISFIAVIALHIRMVELQAKVAALEQEIYRLKILR